MPKSWRYLKTVPLKICREINGQYIPLENTFGLRIYEEDWLFQDKVFKNFIFFDLKNVGNVLGLTDGNKAIVIKEFRPTAKDYLLQLPAGTVEGQESSIKMIKREFLEETGYKAGRLIRLGYSLLSIGRSRTKAYQFLALNCKKFGKPKLDPGEDIRVVLMPLPRLVRLISQGKIKSPMTQVTVFRALLYLGLMPRLKF